MEAALEAKKSWQDTPLTDRAAVSLRAAKLVTRKKRCELIAVRTAALPTADAEPDKD